MRAIWIVLFISTIQTHPAEAASLNQLISNCRAGDSEILSPGANEDPDDFEDRLKVSQAKKEQNCQAAKAALAAQEQELANLDAIMRALTMDEILKPVHKAEAMIDVRLHSLENTLTKMRSIPNQGSSENNAQLRDIDTQLSSEQTLKADLEENWDKLHDSSRQGKLGELIKLKDNDALPAGVKSSIAIYLRTLPPYLIGEGKAPRDKINFLNDQIRLSKMAANTKNLQYTAALRNQIKTDIHKNLGVDALAARASAIRDAMLAEFGSHNPSWANQIAYPQGACRFAREKMILQQSALKQAIILSGSIIQQSLEQELKSEVDERTLVLASLQCNPAQDSLRLVKTLQRQESRLSHCASKDESIRKDAEGIGNDIHTWLEHTATSRPQSEQEYFQSFGEDLWNIASGSIQRCSLRRQQ